MTLSKETKLSTYTIEQPVLFGLDFVTDRHQIVASVLVGRDCQNLHIAPHRYVSVQILFGKDVLELSHERFGQRVEAALDGVVLLSRTTGEAGFHNS